MHVRVAVSQKGLARIGKFLLWPIMQRLDKNFHQSDLLEIFITVPCGLWRTFIPMSDAFNGLNMFYHFTSRWYINK